MPTTIEIQFRDGRTEQRPMTEGTWVIGRETGDVVLADPRVSGLHGELTLKGPLLTFADRDSSNGSFDGDGTRLSGVVVLRQGSVVCMGDSRITVAKLEHANPLKGRTMVMGSAVMPGTSAASAAASASVGGAASPAAPPASGTEPAPPLDSAAAFAATVAHPDQAAQSMAQHNASAADSADDTAAALEAAVAGTPESHPVSGSGPANVWQLEDDGAGTGASTSDVADGAPEAVPAAPASDASSSAVAPGSVPAAAAPASSAFGGSAVTGDPTEPFGVTVTTAAGEGIQGFFEQFLPRLTHIFGLYEPHVVPMAMLVAIVAVPLALINAALSSVPFLGWLAQLVIAPLGTAAMYVWAVGATNQYAARLLRGQPADYASVSSAHRAVLSQWAVSALVAAAPSIASVFLALTVVLAPLTLLLVVPSIMLTWAVGPAFVTENRRGADAALRSYRLFKADWKHILQVFAILIVALLPVVIVSALLGLIPLIGPLVGAAVQLVVMPFAALFSYALYHETVARIQNAGVHVD